MPASPNIVKGAELKSRFASPQMETARETKKAGMATHPQVVRHVGLLVGKSPGLSGVRFT
jgi:hypothetical protein